MMLLLATPLLVVPLLTMLLLATPLLTTPLLATPLLATLLLATPLLTTPSLPAPLSVLVFGGGGTTNALVGGEAPAATGGAFNTGGAPLVDAALKALTTTSTLLLGLLEFLLEDLDAEFEPERPDDPRKSSGKSFQLDVSLALRSAAYAGVGLVCRDMRGGREGGARRPSFGLFSHEETEGCDISSASRRLGKSLRGVSVAKSRGPALSRRAMSGTEDAVGS